MYFRHIFASWQVHNLGYSNTVSRCYTGFAHRTMKHFPRRFVFTICGVAGANSDKSGICHAHVNARIVFDSDRLRGADHRGGCSASLLLPGLLRLPVQGKRRHLPPPLGLKQLQSATCALPDQYGPAVRVDFLFRQMGLQAQSAMRIHALKVGFIVGKCSIRADVSSRPSELTKVISIP